MNDAAIILGLQAENARLKADNDRLRERVETLLSVSWSADRDLISIFDAKAAWSRETFGPHQRVAGVVAHIRKELLEIEADPTDLVEWIDVVMIAMDGAWRYAGADGSAFVAAFKAKHEKNLARTWPDWRTASPDQPIEHVRSRDEAAPTTPSGPTALEVAIIARLEERAESVEAAVLEMLREREAATLGTADSRM